VTGIDACRVKSEEKFSLTGANGVNGEMFFKVCTRQELELILRLYGPLEPWFEKTWRAGEIELMK
jgi:hypothetical protein